MNVLMVYVCERHIPSGTWKRRVWINTCAVFDRLMGKITATFVMSEITKPFGCRVLPKIQS